MFRVNRHIWKLFAVSVMVMVWAAIGAQNFAQPGTPPGGSSTQCSALLQAALESTDLECSDTSRNQACYGHVLNLVSARPDLTSDLVFESQGDKVNLQDVASLELSPLDLVEEHWGVVMMQVQANLPDSLPGQNVTFILFGDVQIENAVGTPVEIETSLLAPSNVRVAPGDTRPVLASFPLGREVIANGKAITASGELWVRVNHDPDEEIYGWVRADLLDIDPTLLPDVQPADQAINPMQAFYFKTGIGAPQCVEAPADGMLIQTPNGAGKVNFTVNGMEVGLGSTAYLTAPEGEFVSCLYLIEGDSDVSAVGETVSPKAGERTCVPLDEDGIAVGAPSEPEPYDAEMVKRVAPLFDLLPEDVELPEAQATRTPTAVPTNTRQPVIVPRSTSTPTPMPTSAPTNIPPTPVPPTLTPTTLPTCTAGLTTPCIPVAQFTYVIDTAISDRTVTFANGSVGATQYRWNFGNSVTSTDANPTYTYPAYGTYEVRLRVENPYGVARMTATITLTDPGLTPPTANFTYNLEIFELFYQDTSIPGSSAISGRNWAFGDGAMSGDVTGSHVYTPGLYNLSLTVTDSSGLSDTRTVTVNVPACNYSAVNGTTLTVNRNGGDPTGTVYEIYLKQTNCNMAGAAGTISFSNPTFSTTIPTGQHYTIRQVAPCTTTITDGIAGTAPIDFTASDGC